MTAIQQIGRIIQERRDHMRITQKQLADMADIGINTLYKIETGQANPTFESLQRITDILGLEITLQVKKIKDLDATS
ncbi:XRE family transcriptional regulator [Gramella sp. BOM4]|nr:XRE family transcriptional regulator [Christiangramia bathymodioli]